MPDTTSRPAMNEDAIRKAEENRMLYDGRIFVRRMSRFPENIRTLLMAEYEALIAPHKDSTDAFIDGRFGDVR